MIILGKRTIEIHLNTRLEDKDMTDHQISVLANLADEALDAINFQTILRQKMEDLLSVEDLKVDIDKIAIAVTED